MRLRVWHSSCVNLGGVFSFQTTQPHSSMLWVQENGKKRKDKQHCFQDCDTIHRIKVESISNTTKKVSCEKSIWLFECYHFEFTSTCTASLNTKIIRWMSLFVKNVLFVAQNEGRQT